METLIINPDVSPLVAPKDGYVLVIRFKLQDRKEFETIFCDYGLFTGKVLQLMGCRCKTFVVGTMPYDYAIKIGNLSLEWEHVMDVLQLPTPPWYYRLEEDANIMIHSGKLLVDVGLLDMFSELTGR